MACCSNAKCKCPSGILAVQDEGVTLLPFQHTLNFTGAGVTATVDPVNKRFNIDVPAGAGGGWTDDGVVVRLTTPTDSVVIGGPVPAAGEKLRVIGDERLEGCLLLLNPALTQQYSLCVDAPGALRLRDVTGAEDRFIVNPGQVGGMSAGFFAQGTFAAGAANSAMFRVSMARAGALPLGGGVVCVSTGPIGHAADPLTSFMGAYHASAYVPVGSAGAAALVVDTGYNFTVLTASSGMVFGAAGDMRFRALAAGAAILDGYNLVPAAPSTGSVGTLALPFALVKADVVIGGDYGFDDPVCAVCQQEFQVSQTVTFKIHKIEGDVKLAVPVHEFCVWHEPK